MNGSLTLPVRPTGSGTYDMAIEVKYGDTTILRQTYQKIGDGTYGFQILYAVRQETAGTPYVITVRVSGTGIVPAENSQQVFP
jgi:hypothetical protein